MFEDVFKKGKKFKRSNYKKAAAFGVGPSSPGYESHHIALKSAVDYQIGNESLAEIAREYGVDEVTREHVESLYHHPLNVVDTPKGDHVEITKEFNRGNEAIDESCFYEFTREQSFSDQMYYGLKSLERNSHDFAWQSYLNKVDYFRNNS